MNRQTIEEIVLRIFSEYQGDISRELMREEVPLDILVEVSARHVHLTESAIEILFGKGKKLTPKKMLSQPGQFLCEERVALVTARGRIENVAVLGPARAAIQTELSATDCRALGIKAPLRLSGDLRDAADVYIIGPCGFVFARNSVIIAQAHIHMTPEQADSAGIRDGEQVCVKLGDERRLSLENVI